MKTIQLVGVGAVAENSNASITPGFPAGALPGDVVLIMATIRNSGAGMPNTPSGWKALLLDNNVALFGRVLTRTDTALPLISFTGGVANATTIARAYAIRYAQPDLNRLVSAVSTQLNGSAQNIATPALTVTADGCLLLHLGWKQVSWTGVLTPTGDVSLAEYSSGFGSTASQIMSGVVQTAATNATAGTFAVSGGSAAISRSATLALAPYTTSWTTVSAASDPCDFADQFNAVAAAACSAMSSIDANIATMTNVPAVRVSGSGVAALNGLLPFSSVDIDPTGLADLVADPYSVLASPAGIWAEGHNILAAYSGTAGNILRFGTSETSYRQFSTRDTILVGNPSGPNGSAPTMELSDEGALVRVGTEAQWFGTSVPANVTPLRSSQFIFRVSD